MGKGDETRRRILEQAARMASVDGLEGVTIGTLARELGLSKSGLYAHFRSKEELQRQVLRTGVEAFVEHVLRPALKVSRGEPRLRALFERWLGWAAGERLPGGCLLTGAAIEMDDRPGPLRDDVAATLDAWLDVLERVTRGAVEEGHFRAELDVRQFAYDVFGIYLAFTIAHRTLRDAGAAARANRALDRLIAAARAGETP